MVQQVTLEELIQCGVERETAIALLPRINQWLAELPATECWQRLTQHLLTPDHPFALHQFLYEITYADWAMEQSLPPAWFPSPDYIQATNIAALMRDLNLSSYADLHAWSIRDRAAFWSVMVQRLGIRWRRPYTQMVDLSQGVESPQWLVNASFNIVESCFQAPVDATAIMFQSESSSLSRWTYRELQSLTNRVSNGLVAVGFQPGDAIAIALPMTAQAVAIYLGIVQAGCVVVAIADSFAPPEIATRLKLGNARAIFTQDYILRGGKQLPLYSKVVAAEASRAIVLPQGETISLSLRSGDIAWADFLSPDDTFTAVAATPISHTNILFSSGTTGTPKAIPWTQTTPIKCAVDGHLHQDIRPGDVVAWSTNLGWMMGPWLIYASLINQAAIALYDGAPTTREYGQFIQSAGVTMLGVVPSLVNAWKTSQCMQGVDWSAIRAFSSTGECSNAQDMLFLMALAGYKPVIEYCGGTEIGGGYITGTVVQPCAPSTCTTPALGLDFVILDGSDRPITKGEGFIIPPAIGLSTELLQQDHHQVYFAQTPKLPLSPPLRRHGDYLEQLPNGYYRVCGRVDDTMNLNGIKVSSADIERVIHQVNGIEEAVVIALPPPTGGPSQLIIYAVATPDTQLSSTELQSLLQTAIARQLNPLFKIADLVLVETIPRTASQKVLRRVLRDRYRAMMANQPISTQ